MSKRNIIWTIINSIVLFFVLILLPICFGVYGKPEGLLTQISTFIFPTISPFIIMLTIVNIVVALIGYQRVNRKYAKIIITITCTFAVVLNILTAVNMGRWNSVVKENGGKYNFLKSVFSVSLCGSETPDERIIYRTVEGENLTVSVYKNKSENENLPVYVYIHGGGWTNNSSETLSGMHRSFADEGFVAFSVNYRLGTKERPTWDKALEDCSYALKWVYENATNYGGNPNNIVLFGESAGGNLALIYSSASASGKINELYGIDVPVPVATCVLYPVVDVKAYATKGRFFTTSDPVDLDTPYFGGTVDEYPKRVAFASPENYLTDKTPATFIIHGAKDSLVTVEGAKSFVNKAKDLGIDAKLVILPYCNHASEIMTNNMTQQADKTMFITFLREKGVI